MARTGKTGTGKGTFRRRRRRRRGARLPVEETVSAARSHGYTRAHQQGPPGGGLGLSAPLLHHLCLARLWRQEERTHPAQGKPLGYRY